MSSIGHSLGSSMVTRSFLVKQVPNVNHPKIEATRYRVVYKKVISRSTLQTCVVDDEQVEIQ